MARGFQSQHLALIFYVIPAMNIAASSTELELCLTDDRFLLAR